MESVLGGARKADLISILGVSDAGRHPWASICYTLCSKLSALGWAVGLLYSLSGSAPRDWQSSPPLPWKAYILHRVLFLVVWAKANESVFTKVLLMELRGRSVWKTLLCPPDLGRKQNSYSE